MQIEYSEAISPLCYLQSTVFNDDSTEPNAFPAIMTYETLLVQRHAGGFLTVTLNRPDKLNALNIKLLAELHGIIADVQRDETMGGVIITGSGEKAFAAGADIAELHSLDGYTGAEYSRRGQHALLAIERLDRPVIAAVNGFALGGGCELAMACHIRIASTKGRFGQPEVGLGIIPGFGGTQRLARLIGQGRAIEYNLTGDMIDASTAERFGLVNHVVEPSDLMPRAEEMMAKILAKGPVAVRKALVATRSALDLTVDEGMDLEARLFGECCGTADFKEGTEAFLEKRGVRFRGR